MTKESKTQNLEQLRVEELIFNAVRLKDPDIIHETINYLLAQNPNANLNPTLEIGDLFNSTYSPLSILQKKEEQSLGGKVRQLPKPAHAKHYSSEYCPKCEIIFVTRLALQEVEKNNFNKEIENILKKIVENSYDFTSLDEDKKSQISALDNLEENSYLGIFQNLFNKEFSKTSSRSPEKRVIPTGFEKLEGQAKIRRI